jgi:hypothetical protein
MNSFDLTKFRNQLLAENRTVKKRTLKENYDPDVIDEIREYFETIIQNQPEDVLELIMDLVKNDGSNWSEWIDNIQADIVDSYGGDYDGAIRGYREDEDEDFDELDEGTLEEMASFYKLTDNSPEAKAAIAAEKEKFKPGTTLYNTLDTLEKTGEIDYKELAKATGKDMATFNNPKSRGVLEKDLAAFVQAGSSPSAVRTGRPADPNKAAAAPKEKTAKLKITTPSPQSSKLADLAPSDVFSSTGPDEEEMDMEKQATKAAKGNKRLGTTVEKLAQVTKEMKALAKEYQAAKGTPEEAGIIAQLKDLTAEKKALEKKSAPRQMSAADLMGGDEMNESDYKNPVKAHMEKLIQAAKTSIKSKAEILAGFAGAGIKYKVTTAEPNVIKYWNDTHGLSGEIKLKE